MTLSLAERGIRGIVLDIEGTTTPISFVYDVLFPYARRHLRAYLHSHREDAEVVRAIELLGREADDADGADALAGRFEELMDRDAKSPALKLLQGEIWKVGYASGELRGDVFADVPPALARWKNAGIDVAIYSSGSVLAQKLIFGTTPAGDLTRFIGHFFDTGVGAKRDVQSYRRIAESMGREPRELVFVSDVAAELEAARSARMDALLCVRPGNPRQHWLGAGIRSFDEIGV